MLFDFAAVGVFILVAVAFVFGSLLVGWAVRPSKPSPEKASIYECGEPPIGPAWVRYNIRFYTIALVYLIFDVEAVFLFPVALVLRQFKGEGMGGLAFMEILFFVMVLVVGLIYAWRYGNLDWVGSEELSEQASEGGA
ncbi:MAG: NADH-quinone oxidoreductase subunit A [Candidatus Sumerlaeota bacterium]|nr:NADH-quinone oxidoreductase subunit A [Candidatus Sumerlaeota bacterium]